MFEQSARDPGTPVNARLSWLADQLAVVPRLAGPGRRSVRRRLGGAWSARRPAAELGGEPIATEGNSSLPGMADRPRPAAAQSRLLGGKAVRSWMPDGGRRRLAQRWLPGGAASLLAHRGVMVALALLAAAAVVVGGLAFFGPSPAAEVAPSLPAARAQVPTAAKPAAGDKLVISVVGLVRSPGLVTVPSGSRVADALRAAGGANPGVDLTALNLARKLADGEQLAVGIPAAQAAPAGAGAAASKIDLNAATAEQLDTLPGVGEVTARRIVDWRTQHGGFSSVEQLRDVDGIGESKFQKLREQVTAG